MIYLSQYILYCFKLLKDTLLLYCISRTMTEQEQTPKTPKEQMNELMVEVFGMIEDLDIGDGKYIQFAELFKQMNINVNRLAEIRKEVQANHYYTHFVRPTTKTTLKRKKLTEEQKRQDPKNYLLCNCGRYCSKTRDFYEEHLKTMVHYQGRRNKKYASKKLPEATIKEMINREVLLQSFLITHIENVNGWHPDDEGTDEV